MPSHPVIKRVLLVDIPTYKIRLPALHRDLLRKRLCIQTALWQQRTGARMIRPGLTYSRGLLMIAACLEQHGFSVKYLIYSDPIDRAHILDFSKESDAVCVTATTPALGIAAVLCEQIKKLKPEVVTILGGPHASSLPVDTLHAYPSIDFAMIGECENRLPALLSSIERPDSIGGTAYRTGQGGVQVSDVPVEPVVVSELPFPAYHQLTRPLSEYAHNIQTSRGCPYKCSFCAERLSWDSSLSSMRTVQQVVDEITFLSSSLVPGTLVHFSDAVFNVIGERTAVLADRIKHDDFGLLFSFDTRVDLVKQSELRALAEAGFLYVRMGFESFRDTVLCMAQKSITSETGWQAGETVRSASPRMAIHAYMLTGLPGSTRLSLVLDAANLREMIERDVVDIVGNKILVPYPGTAYHHSPSEFGIEIQIDDWSKYDRRSYPVYRLENLSADEIYFGYLYQESVLTEAYFDKWGGAEPSYDDIQMGLDYLYGSYLGKESTEFTS